MLLTETIFSPLTKILNYIWTTKKKEENNNNNEIEIKQF